MPLSDSMFVISKSASRPNSSLTVRTKSSSANASVKYINYQLVTIPGTFTISA